MIPWFMYDFENNQLITSKFVPSDIQDTKRVILTEVPIPGRNYSPVVPGGNGNRRISFSLPLLHKGDAGNIIWLKQFQLLRNQVGSLFNAGRKQFAKNPRVIYYYGTGSVPLVYWVAKADIVNKEHWNNRFGIPQYSIVNIELILDERNIMYKAEEAFRFFTGIAGTFAGTLEVLNQ
jgi:hypothetical protein